MITDSQIVESVLQNKLLARWFGEEYYATVKVLLLILFFAPQILFADPYQLGLGLSKQRLNTNSFQNSASESRGHFDFTAIEFRAAYAFVSNDSSTLSLEGQFLRSLESQSSTSGGIDFQLLAFNGTLNLGIWNQLGIEAGATFFSLLNSPKKEMENPGGVGILYGLTYLLNQELQLRLRREDKAFMNSYDIQPGYSFSLSYLFK